MINFLDFKNCILFGGHMLGIPQGAFLSQKLPRNDKVLENEFPKQVLTNTLVGIIGTSDQINRSRLEAMSVSQYDVNVLLLGETGVGKDLFAETIHKLSSKRRGPFIVVNCSALQDTLLESEIFGHEKGSFTGAITTKHGKLEVANGGTLFLNEVGEMSIAAQCKLLTALENRSFERVGGVRKIEVDVRIISATNADLRKKIEEYTFRQDLFYRLDEFSIKIPPLRERREDIGLLVNYYLDRLCKRFSQNLPVIDPGLLKALNDYPWPGNVRELKNALSKALISKNDSVGVLNTLNIGDFSYLNFFLDIENKKIEDGIQNQSFDLKKIGAMASEEAERKIVLKVLNQTRWNKKEAARRMFVSYRGLRNKLKKWQMNKPAIL